MNPIINAGKMVRLLHNLFVRRIKINICGENRSQIILQYQFTLERQNKIRI